MSSEADRIRELGDTFRDRLDDTYIDVALDYINYNESSLAFEFLCDYLVEHDVPITACELERIRALARDIVLTRGYFNMRYLEELVIASDCEIRLQ